VKKKNSKLIVRYCIALLLYIGEPIQKKREKKAER
jgi:hypothetical protein